MPDQKEQHPFPRILFSCYAYKNREGEQFVPGHVLGYLSSGTLEVYVGGKTYLFKEGDMWFFKKNQLAKFVKTPPQGGELRSISIFMDQDTLHSVAAENNYHVGRLYTGESGLRIKPGKLFQNYIDSLTPYLDDKNNISKALAGLKVKEAVMILLETYPELKDVLFDFSEPGKIDLEAYMNEHYKFNVDLSRFAYLTGRSLATFKRDFQKIFNTSPNRWLQQKRLGDAFYLIKEKGWRSSDVYLEVGFKDLSHFSFAFKKAFGIAPSLVSN